MECICSDGDKKQFHMQLYHYGVEENICRLTSAKSVKSVHFICNTCYEFTSGKVCDILTHEGQCKVCLVAKKEEQTTTLHETIKQELRSTALGSCIEKQELMRVVATKFDISETKCRELYNEIPIDVWVNIPIDYNAIVVPNHVTRCDECGKKIPKMKDGKMHVWKENYVCDSCWSNHRTERHDLWNAIREKYGNDKACAVCSMIKEKDDVRFHFDHLNMFDKNNSVSTMVMEGCTIDEIWDEIKKCQFICLSCHDIITEIENRLPFTQVKRNLTRDLNECEITVEHYENEIEKWKHIYADKMKDVYSELRQAIIKANECADKCPYCLEPIFETEYTHPNLNQEILKNRYIDQETKVTLKMDVDANALGKYTCEKCKNSVHYACFENDKRFQLHETNEYKVDNETYESDEEDIELQLPCPCCRHPNLWYRQNVSIVSERENRANNPYHVEHHVQKQFKITTIEYLKTLERDQCERIIKSANRNGHTIRNTTNVYKRI